MSVRTIRAMGVYQEQSVGSFSGVSLGPGGVMPVMGSTTQLRTHTSPLAAATAPAVRSPHPNTGTAIFGIGASAVFVLVIVPIMLGFLSWESEQGTSIGTRVVGVLFFLGVAVPGVVASVVALTRWRRNRLLERGHSAAMSVWGAGWYCHHCHGCFWDQVPAEGIPARTLLTAPQFREAVWNVGVVAAS